MCKNFEADFTANVTLIVECVNGISFTCLPNRFNSIDCYDGPYWNKEDENN